MMERQQKLQAIASTRGRKELDKELAKARKEFAKAKADYDSTSSQLENLQSRVQDAESRMTNARQNIVNLSEHIQMMDLTGAGAVRDRGEVRTYIMDGKEYYAEKNEDGNDVRVVPWKEYKKKKDDECKVDDNLALDNYLGAMSILSEE